MKIRERAFQAEEIAGAKTPRTGTSLVYSKDRRQAQWELHGSQCLTEGVVGMLIEGWVRAEGAGEVWIQFCDGKLLL